MAEIEPLDIIVATILVIASLRGWYLGLVREAFSLIAIGAAYLAVRGLAHPTAEWLTGVSDGAVGPRIAPWITGAFLLFSTATAVTLAGRVVRRSVRAVGLAIVDRLGGALLGATEGALIVALLLVLAGRGLGWDHSFLANTRTLAALEQLEILARDSSIADFDVASPPPNRPKP